MQMEVKAAGRGFKIYSLGHENYLVDWLFTSKVSLLFIKETGDFYVFQTNNIIGNIYQQIDDS